MKQQQENKQVEKQVEYKTAEGVYRMMFDGKWLPLDKVYERTFKKADKAGVFKREVTASFPNFDKPDKEQTVTLKAGDKAFEVTEHKYGNKSVCFMKVDGKDNLRFVSKKVVISMIADNSDKSWNWVDQALKGLLGLKTNATSKANKEVVEI